MSLSQSVYQREQPIQLNDEGEEFGNGIKRSAI
jgi:hypothetical protein